MRKQTVRLRMTISSLFVFGVFRFTALYAQPQQEWIDNYGVIPFTTAAEVKGMVVDSNENIYVISWRDTTWPTTMSDAYPLIIKYNSSGIKLWEHNCQDTVYKCNPYSIVPDNKDNLYVTVSNYDTVNSTGICSLFKYDGLGNIEWIVSINDSCPNSKIGGYINDNIYTFSMSAGTGYLSKYNSNGGLIWEKINTLGGSVFLSKSENVYLAGGSWTDTTNTFYLAKVDSSGMQKWTETHMWPSTAQLTDYAIDNKENIYLGGWYYGIDQDYCLIKYDSSGNQKWVATFNHPVGNWVDKAYAMAVDKQGNVYITGEAHLYCCPSSVDGDFTTVKYDSSGTFQWVQYYNGTGDSTDQAFAIALDDSGNVYVAGNSWGGSGTEKDYAIVKYDPSGNQKWVVRYDGGGAEFANQLIVDKNGNIYVSGFGPTIKYSQGWSTGIEKEFSTDAGIQFTIYPNPFSQSATIEFALPAPDYVKLEVYNYLGTRVVKLYEGNTEGEKLYSYRFDAENLPGGLYFYSLQTKFRRYVRKIVVVK